MFRQREPRFSSSDVVLMTDEAEQQELSGNSEEKFEPVWNMLAREAHERLEGSEQQEIPVLSDSGEVTDSRGNSTGEKYSPAVEDINAKIADKKAKANNSTKSTKKTTEKPAKKSEKDIEKGSDKSTLDSKATLTVKETNTKDGKKEKAIEVQTSNKSVRFLLKYLSLIHISEPTRRTPISY